MFVIPPCDTRILDPSLAARPSSCCSCGSAAWSPGISRLLDECIGSYFAGGCSSVLELAGEAGSSEGSSQEEAEGTAAARSGAASSSSGRRCVSMAGAVDGSVSTQEEACPDPADLPFLSAAASPAAGCEKRPPPGDGVVATARALLAELLLGMRWWRWQPLMTKT